MDKFLKIFSSDGQHEYQQEGQEWGGYHIVFWAWMVALLNANGDGHHILELHIGIRYQDHVLGS
jgi:hypothetical protein